MSATVALSLAVALHVGWNLLARHVPGRQEFIWWALAGHLLLIGSWAVPVLFLTARWDGELLACSVVSALALAVYFLGLRWAYRHAPVALAYPIARSSPLFIALVGMLAFDAVLSVEGWVGIAISSFALLMLASSAWRLEARRAIAPALLAALGTTAYSLADKQAVNHLPSLTAQLGYISLGYLAAWLALSAQLRLSQGHWRPRARPPLGLLVAGALSIGSSYALIVHAMVSLPAAYVVALSNGGIVIAALLSVFWFKEKEHRTARLFWAGILTVGLALVLLAGS